MSEAANSTAFEKPDSAPTEESYVKDKAPETKEDLEELLRFIINHGTRLTHDVSQPLTFMLTSLEMGTLEGGMDQEDCQLLLSAALQMRTELQNFRELLRKAENI